MKGNKIIVQKFITIACCLFLFILSTGQTLANTSFPEWLKDLEKEAISKGISKNTANKALDNIKPISRIIELDRKQPEKTISFSKYKSNVLTKGRIEQGRRLYKEHKTIIDDAAKEYGVPGNYIVALWGIETSYGNNTGGFRVIEALATLAYDGRRSNFFRNELIEALKIIDDGHISHKEMKGSWAGAMGQNQFMPSSFHKFAVDGNNDKKKDIWNSLPDVFASTANYLGKSGWIEDEKWGRKIILPPDFPENDIGLIVSKTLETWKKNGITLQNGSPIPVVKGMEASVVAPDGVNGDAYLIYNNYRVIMKWNKSTYFSTCVGLLADEIVQ